MSTAQAAPQALDTSDDQYIDITYIQDEVRENGEEEGKKNGERQETDLA